MEIDENGHKVIRKKFKTLQEMNSWMFYWPDSTDLEEIVATRCIAEIEEDNSIQEIYK